MLQSIDGAGVEQIQRCQTGCRSDHLRMLFCEPLDPGTSTPYADLEELAIACSEVKGLLVVDEAYAEFSKEKSAVNLISKYPNVVVVRTMSKAFAFAGARVGYAVCDEAIVDAMLVTRLPYHLSSTTQALALVALDNSKALLAEVDALVAERDRVETQLTKLGFEVSPSSANFLLFRGFSADSKTAWESLVAVGILVRDVGLSGYLRVTICRLLPCLTQF